MPILHTLGVAQRRGSLFPYSPRRLGLAVGLKRKRKRAVGLKRCRRKEKKEERRLVWLTGLKIFQKGWEFPPPGPRGF